jgi:hypothetical protein
MEVHLGLEHLRVFVQLSEQTREETESKLVEHALSLNLIGTSLEALHTAATCRRTCSGGMHVLEAIAGRAYNLGVASYVLSCRGLYDESLNLTRSLGEIANIIMLSGIDKVWLDDWLHSDQKTRIAKFKPGHVRKRLEETGTPHVADRTWYSVFCENFTHVTPDTKPNMHNPGARGYVGGVFQSHGLAYSLSELANAVTAAAMPICAYFKLDDILDDLRKRLDSLE